MARELTESGCKIRIVVLISGSGTNLQALINACQSGGVLTHCKIVRVISDRKNAYGLKRAEQAGITTSCHGVLPYKKRFPDNSENPQFMKAREAYDADLAEAVQAEHPNIVVCAGFMRIVTPAFLVPLSQAGVPVINLHPSLHGDLVGAGCIQRAWEEFESEKRSKTGIMIHYVIVEVDMGEPIVQQEVSIEGCASLKELEERIHEAEHKLIVEGTRLAIEKSRS